MWRTYARPRGTGAQPRPVPDPPRPTEDVRRTEERMIFMVRSAVSFAAILSAALLFGAASAAPQVAPGQLQIAGGTVQSYLAQHGTVAPVSGPCYTHTQDPNGSYTCLDQALHTTGLAASFGGATARTLFAPNDTAFQQLEASVGMGRFENFMNDKAALTRLIQGNTVPGAVTAADLAYHASLATGSETLTSHAGAPLTLALGSTNPSSGATSVAVGPAGAASGQAYVFGQDVSTANGVIIPIDRIDLPSRAL